MSSIVPDSALGAFQMETGPGVPLNVFVSREWLAGELAFPERANLFLAGAIPGGLFASERLADALGKILRPEHAGLVIRSFETLHVIQLSSDRVFLDPEAGRAAFEAAPGAAGVLTWLVNGITHDAARKSTPYSFMTAVSPAADARISPVPAGMTDREIVINRWLADHLAAKAGDSLTVAYFVPAPGGGFTEASRRFTVRRIAEMDDIAAERTLMPDFPGLSDVERCGDWDIGIPLDAEKLKDKDNEAYWNAFRQTPKAFVTLAAGQAMWASRFGALTAVRFPRPPGGDAAVVTAVTRALDPAALGLVFLPAGENARRAVEQAVDFGGLFLGLSIVLILAALLLAGMLFVFGMEQRSREMGILLATGWRRERIRGIFLREGALLAGAGAAAGALPGMTYARIFIMGLNHWWRDAVAGAEIPFAASPGSVATGAAVTFLAALATLALALRRRLRHSPHTLLTADFTRGIPAESPPGNAGIVLAGVCAAGALGIVTYAIAAGTDDPTLSFFMAGFLMLAAELAGAWHALGRRGNGARTVNSGTITLAHLGVRNAARRRGRSVAVIGLLAGGCFLVAAVSAMKENIGARADRRDSGTGGFALLGETALPFRELPAPDRLPPGVTVVPFKIYDGDDASCLTLARAQSPRLVGVDPADMIARGAFVRPGRENPWERLREKLPGGVIPALAGDDNTARWNLQKKTGPDGDVLEYRDERRNPFRVKLMGTLPVRLSVFQGMILISREAFSERFPAEDGFRMFLADAPPGAAGAARQALSREFDRAGADIVPARERLLQFYSVEAAYLGMFLALGGLGLILGSAGMGVVVLRNVLERRRELAILRAVGFRRGALHTMLVAEHAVLLAGGLAVGTLAAAVALAPSFLHRGPDAPLVPLAGLLAAVTASGLAWTLLATWLATRGNLTGALRNE
ncbi:MAG: FtsX-like permease family protein [Planctomycetota bacterium]